ncbi:polyprenyl synthetase family protein [Streptomyces sp. NPDC059788]|uniref:polyprenyl synthetase family protein n=1 Tax=Streptomyces sp. NPDC059788 TaxID=3346948 RepID=UPI003647AD7D
MIHPVRPPHPSRPGAPLRTGSRLADTRRAIDAHLTDFLDAKTHASKHSPVPDDVPEILGQFLFHGGKRLRPLLCVNGWHAAGGQAIEEGGGEPHEVIRVAASLEMFHAFCLIHDDIMDSSDLRRGHPTLHRAFSARHSMGRNPRQTERVGTNLALLVGDLALVWSDELLHDAGLAPARLSRLLPLIDTMRCEVMYGQYLDVAATGRPTPDLGHAMEIVRYKTAKYTVERPLHIGATLAGATPELLRGLTAYALPLGEAFQLRDDLLGAFNSPAITGKADTDDLRDGKHTVLLATALQSADPTQYATLHALLSAPRRTHDETDRLRRLLAATGARDHVENKIKTCRAQALHALEQIPLPSAAGDALREMADAATLRTK